MHTSLEVASTSCGLHRPGQEFWHKPLIRSPAKKASRARWPAPSAPRKDQDKGTKMPNCEGRSSNEAATKPQRHSGAADHSKPKPGREDGPDLVAPQLRAKRRRADREDKRFCTGQIRTNHDDVATKSS